MNAKTLLTTGLTLVFFGTAVFAQKPHNGNGRPGCFWKDMKLTTEQQEQLKTLHDEMQKTRKSHKQEVKAIRKKIADELLKDNPSTANLDTCSKELGDLHMKMTQERYSHLLNVKKILTAEQFKTMLSHHGKDGHFRHKGKKGPANHGGKHAGGCAKGENANHPNQKGTVE